MAIIKVRNTVASAALIVSLFANSLVPSVLAADSTLIGGNGSGSSTSVSMTNNKSNTVVQDNYASIQNRVDSNSSTGGNVASGNTGGEVFIGTGNSNQQVSIDNMANQNLAHIGGTGSQGSTNNVSVLGNGSNSQNFLSNTSDTTNSIYQTNDAYFDNSVNLSAETGGNIASDNTGRVGGNSPVRILTGNATSGIDINNAANSNHASIGGMSGSGSGWSGFDISGNGSGSLNSVEVSGDHTNSIVQDNNADFSNQINQWLSSGGNLASANTGGETLLGTGSISALSWLDNKANFNHASLDTGNMTMDNPQGARITGNGSNSESFFIQSGNHSNEAFQTGNAFIDNYLTDYSDSGRNYSTDNTGSINGFGATRVLSGSSMSNSYISNQSNVNSYGTAMTMPGGWALSLGWDWSSLMGM